MASNRVLNPTKDRAWFYGFGNMFYKENHQWWGTRSWLVQFLIWTMLINGMLLYIILTTINSPAFQQIRQTGSEAEIAAKKADIGNEGLMIYFVFAGLMAAGGVAVLAQDALIGEKRAGTAAWVLSKPISRNAFLLAKLVADVMGILITMVIVQGVIAYWILKANANITLPLPNCLAAMGLVVLMLLYFLSLTYMLGAVSNSRPLTIGLPLLLVFFGSNIGNLVPFLAKTMPWNLVMDLRGNPALAIALIKGQPLTTVTPIICTAVMSVLFVLVAFWRFQREEF
jgi:ABC-2 type transport system permease protein